MTSHRRSAIKTAAFALIAMLGLDLCAATAFAQAPPPRPGRIIMDPRARLLSYNFPEAQANMTYCVYASSKVSRRKAAPLIVSLHGLGSGPEIMCNTTAVDLAEAGGYVLVAPLGYSTAGWYGSPVIVMGAGARGPRGPGAPGASPGAGPATPTAPPPVAATGPSPERIAQLSEQDVMNVLALIRKEYKIDPSRIYLTGHSMGGAGALFLGARHTDLWAAVAPVAPASFMMNERRAEILKSMQDAGVPILLITGAADEVVPLANTRMWAETMKELGMEHEYVEQSGVTHGPIITSSQADIYAFFARYRKK